MIFGAQTCIGIQTFLVFQSILLFEAVFWTIRFLGLMSLLLDTLVFWIYWIYWELLLLCYLYWIWNYGIIEVIWNLLRTLISIIFAIDYSFAL